jgi:hypothetical protein
MKPLATILILIVAVLAILLVAAAVLSAEPDQSTPTAEGVMEHIYRCATESENGALSPDCSTFGTPVPFWPTTWPTP